MANGKFAGGTGTQADPYLIEDVPDMIAMRNKPAAHYKFIANIDMDLPEYVGDLWKTITPPSTGTTVPFTGTIDGNHCSIVNFRGNNPIFDTLKDTTLKNLSVRNVSSDAYGILVKGTHMNGVIEGCSVQGTLGGSNSRFGLICANSSDGNLIIRNCSVDIEASGMQGTGARAGGIIGYFTGNSLLIENCYVKGSLLGSDANIIGGIIGAAKNTTIKNCYTQVDLRSTRVPTISMAGIIGQADTGNKIINCYTSANLSYLPGATRYDNVIGATTGSSVTVDIQNSFYNKEATNATNEVRTGLTALTTAQLKTPSTFAAWSDKLADQKPVWQLVDGEYPKLWFEKPPAYKANITLKDTLTNKVIDKSVSIYKNNSLHATKNSTNGLLELDELDKTSVWEIRFAGDANHDPITQAFIPGLEVPSETTVLVKPVIQKPFTFAVTGGYALKKFTLRLYENDVLFKEEVLQASTYTSPKLNIEKSYRYKITSERYEPASGTISMNKDVIAVNFTLADLGSLHRKKITRDEWLRINKINVLIK